MPLRLDPLIQQCVSILKLIGTLILIFYAQQVAEIGEKMGSKDAHYEGWAAKTSLGKLAKPEDIASLVSFLASPDSHMVTGQTVSYTSSKVSDCV